MPEVCHFSFNFLASWRAIAALAKRLWAARVRPAQLDHVAAPLMPAEPDLEGEDHVGRGASSEAVDLVVAPGLVMAYLGLTNSMKC